MSNCSEYVQYVNDTRALERKRAMLLHEYVQLHGEWTNAIDYGEEEDEIDAIRADMDHIRAQMREIDALLAA